VIKRKCRVQGCIPFKRRKKRGAEGRGGGRRGRRRVGDVSPILKGFASTRGETSPVQVATVFCEQSMLAGAEVRVCLGPSARQEPPPARALRLSLPIGVKGDSPRAHPPHWGARCRSASPEGVKRAVAVLATRESGVRPSEGPSFGLSPSLRSRSPSSAAGVESSGCRLGLAPSLLSAAPAEDEELPATVAFGRSGSKCHLESPPSALRSGRSSVEAWLLPVAVRLSSPVWSPRAGSNHGAFSCRDDPDSSGVSPLWSLRASLAAPSGRLALP